MQFQPTADWDQLLQQSERLASQDNYGFPRFHRDIQQVEAMSNRLKTKTQAMDQDENIFAGTRLLAQEGIDTRMIDRALDDVEIRPTHDDVFNLEADSVEEYLEKVHEMTLISAIQEVQEEVERDFDDFMLRALQDEWNDQKKKLFNTTFRTPDQSLALTSQSPSNQLALPGNGVDESAVRLHGREKDYVAVVGKMNEARLLKQPYDVVSHFHSAAERDVSDSERKATVARLWAVLQSILVEAKAAPNNHKARTQAMLRGASKYLERGHAQFIQTTLQANRSQAHLGGVPSHKGQIQAFMRLGEKGGVPFDFDATGGQDTTWQRVFLCLRSGYSTEACEIAERSSRSLLLDGSSLAKHLKEWVTNEHRLPQQSTIALAEECERLKISADRSKWQKPQFQYKFAVQTLLSGSRKASDTLLREGAAVFRTIEDFMWFMVSLVQFPAASTSGQLRVGPGALSESYKLQDLQHYIVQFPSTHYSQGGKEPLLYATVLLLSLQFKAAIAFLAKDVSARTYKIDAPHLAIALMHSQVLNGGGDGDAGNKEGVDTGELLHAYGAQFVSRAPEIGLEYYILASEAMGNDKQVKAQLLKELLTESNAFGFLLGAGGNTGGTIDKWIGTGAERNQMLEAVAYSCRSSGQLDWASELYLNAGAPRPALHLINMQISNLVEAAVTSTSEEEELENLSRRGSEAVQMLSSSREASSDVEIVTYRQLQQIYQLLHAQRQGNSMKGVELLQKLDFVPLDSFRLSRCTEAVTALPDAIAQRLPAILLAAAKILAGVNQVNQLRTVVAFAGNLPQRISPGTFQEMNQIYNSIS